MLSIEVLKEAVDARGLEMLTYTVYNWGLEVVFRVRTSGKRLTVRVEAVEELNFSVGIVAARTRRHDT